MLQQYLKTLKKLVIASMVFPGLSLPFVVKLQEVVMVAK
jgi:hypothetical protein